MSDSRQKILAELEQLRARQAELETALAQVESTAASWPPVGYYTAYHLLSGTILGMFGAAISLLFNVIGSAMVGQHPLQLIRVYLTFPLGEEALLLDQSTSLAIGCFLYLGTGAILGALVHVLSTRYMAGMSFGRRLGSLSGLAVLLWLVNFYAVLSWLQPLLFDGNWIVSMVPWWVGLTTHLVFVWTISVLEPWGRFRAVA